MAVALAKKGLLMRHNRLSIGLRAALVIFTVTLLVTNCRATIHETVLHSFNPSGAEAFPYAGLIVENTVPASELPPSEVVP